jgi:hypothetical protein
VNNSCCYDYCTMGHHQIIEKTEHNSTPYVASWQK